MPKNTVKDLYQRWSDTFAERGELPLEPALRRAGPARGRRRAHRSVRRSAAHVPDWGGPVAGSRRRNPAAGRLGPTQAGSVREEQPCAS